MKNYRKEELEKALEEVREGESMYRVSKKYGIPRSTIHFALRGLLYFVKIIHVSNINAFNFHSIWN